MSALALISIGVHTSLTQDSSMDSSALLKSTEQPGVSGQIPVISADTSSTF